MSKVIENIKVFTSDGTVFCLPYYLAPDFEKSWTRGGDTFLSFPGLFGEQITIKRGSIVGAIYWDKESIEKSIAHDKESEYE